MTFKMGKKRIKENDFYVIAEIGNNHQGSAELCCKLMALAVDCGADAVKLQKRNVETFWPKEVLDMPYINPNSFGATYREHKKALELNRKEWEKVVIFAKKHKITLFSTVFDEESIDFLERYDFPAYKIASAGHTDKKLIQKAIETGRSLIISVGGGDWNDFDELTELLEFNKVYWDKAAFLHCTALYPPTAEQMNLLVIEEMKKRAINRVVGLSDHFVHSGDKGIMVYGAFMLGARMFEKHFTINCAWKGPDHHISMEPIEFLKMKEGLERLAVAMGDGQKRVYEGERPNISKMKKWRS